MNELENARQCVASLIAERFDDDWSVWQTGGGYTSLALPLSDGSEIMITSNEQRFDPCHAPTTLDDDCDAYIHTNHGAEFTEIAVNKPLLELMEIVYQECDI